MKTKETGYYAGYAKTRRNFPNAATQSYRVNRIIDCLLTCATTLGIVVAILFLFTL